MNPELNEDDNYINQFMLFPFLKVFESFEQTED